MMSRWVVPQDDTNTMFIELRHVSETEGVTPAWWGDPTKMTPGGQLPAASYEAGQRQPGDYEAQVSQRPIAIHGLEHLGITDRGVSMFRNQTRRGVRAVQLVTIPPGSAVTPVWSSRPTATTPSCACRPMRTRQSTVSACAKSGGADGYIKDPPLLAEIAASQR